LQATCCSGLLEQKVYDRDSHSVSKARRSRSWGVASGGRFAALRGVRRVAVRAGRRRWASYDCPPRAGAVVAQTVLYTHPSDHERPPVGKIRLTRHDSCRLSFKCSTIRSRALHTLGQTAVRLLRRACSGAPTCRRRLQARGRPRCTPQVGSPASIRGHPPARRRPINSQSC